MRLTIDNTIAVKWVIEEAGSLRARSYLPVVKAEEVLTPYFLSAPALIELEFHNTLSKKLKNGVINRQQFSLGKLLGFREVQIDPVDAELVREAADYSIGGRVWLANFEGRIPLDAALPFSIYDCLYMAHARQQGNALLTADKEQARIAQAIGIPVEFVPTE
ncbi:MAG: hypothetical protein FD175_1250 [Beijerinckiaceae bacterium]|nr:MAG: hypothetical protein FD175_1250 [Beijerinckiaceae bacterium]